MDPTSGRSCRPRRCSHGRLTAQTRRLQDRGISRLQHIDQIKDGQKPPSGMVLEYCGAARQRSPKRTRFCKLIQSPLAVVRHSRYWLSAARFARANFFALICVQLRVRPVSRVLIEPGCWLIFFVSVTLGNTGEKRICGTRPRTPASCRRRSTDQSE